LTEIGSALVDGKSVTADGPRCPLCDGGVFEDFRGRVAERCVTCGAFARTRSAWLLLTEVAKVGPESRILHVAPDGAFAPRLHALCGAGYEPCDIDEGRFGFPFPVRHIDLCRDLGSLPQDAYDVVMHNHVIEHVICNYTIVLQKLHRLVRPGGWHIFSFPIGRGRFRENFDDKMTAEERKRVFGKDDHIRRFTRGDFERTVGQIFDLRQDWSLASLIPPERLLAAGIPRGRWTVELGPVFAVRRDA
jgi:SAM-dependent methyltransferase